MSFNPSLFKNIVDQSFLGIIVFNKGAFTCAYANQRAKDLLGYGEKEISVSGLNVGNLKPGQRTMNIDLLEMRGTFDDIYLKKSDGGILVTQSNVAPMDDNHILLMFQDTTFQKKLQREIMTKQAEIFQALGELEKQNEELRNLDKAKDRFIALTSHELRTPISAIVATAQFIHDGLCDDTKELHSHVDVILDEAKHLLEMVNDILDFQKAQMGKLELYVEQLDVDALIKHSITNMVQFAQTKSIQIEYSGGPTTLAYCDSLRITQVFYNVLSNAVKFSPEKSKIHVDVTAGTTVKIAFRDSGPGIPEDQAEKVFNEFETIENLSNHHKGTGLGMPICRRLMEQMGGKISFTSEVGRGTTFVVEIPAEKILPADSYRKRPMSHDLIAA